MLRDVKRSSLKWKALLPRLRKPELQCSMRRNKHNGFQSSKPCVPTTISLLGRVHEIDACNSRGCSFSNFWLRGHQENTETITVRNRTRTNTEDIQILLRGYWKKSTNNPEEACVDRKGDIKLSSLSLEFLTKVQCDPPQKIMKPDWMYTDRLKLVAKEEKNTNEQDWRVRRRAEEENTQQDWHDNEWQRKRQLALLAHLSLYENTLYDNSQEI